MRTYFLCILCFMFVYSCKKSETQLQDKDSIIISKRVGIQVDRTLLRLRSNQFLYEFEKESLPLKKIVVLNASLLGYLSELNLEKKIVGVTSPEYIYSEKILNQIKHGATTVVGSEYKYNIEKIIALRPDVVFTNYIPNFDGVYNILRKNDIKVVFLDDYLESTPLEKTAYLKVFGILLGKETLAKKQYGSIKSRYERWSAIAQNQANKPNVLSNEMYAGQWFVPGNQTFVYRYFKDAGGRYVFYDLDSDKALPKSFEQVFTRSKKASVWVNLSYASKQEMRLVYPIYTRMTLYQKGRLYNIHKRKKGLANDYFQSGAVRADLLLRDYIKVFYPNLFPEDTLVYIAPLK